MTFSDPAIAVLAYVYELLYSGVIASSHNKRCFLFARSWFTSSPQERGTIIAVDTPVDASPRLAHGQIEQLGPASSRVEPLVGLDHDSPCVEPHLA